MTREEKAARYRNLVNGQELIESWYAPPPYKNLIISLHIDLAEQINSEIGLKLITNLSSAILWLKSTFFYTRVKKQPAYYGFESQNIDQQMKTLCCTALSRLADSGLIGNVGDHVASSASGLASAKYYVKIETMKAFLGLQKNSNESSVVSYSDGFVKLILAQRIVPCRRDGQRSSPTW